MSVKARVGTFMAVCLVTGAGLAAMRGTSENARLKGILANRDELVSIVVSFVPTPREHEIAVSWSAPGPVQSDTPVASPWVREVMVPTGTRVMVSATQRPYEGQLFCKIRKGLKYLSKNDNVESKSTTILCEAVT